MRPPAHRAVAPGCSFWLATLLLAVLLLPSPGPAAKQPWRIAEQLDLPGWLSVYGGMRLRYETLDNTYRIIDPGFDQFLVSRLLLAVEASGEHWYAGVELQDSRAWLHGELSPLGTDDVNALEPLRVYAGFRHSNAIADGDQLDVRVGRMSFDLGSRRLIARNRFRNTANSFAGARATWVHANGVGVQAFYLLPANRLPNALDDERLRNNKFNLDDTDTGQALWGTELSGLALGRRLFADFYLLRMQEDDRPILATRNRRITTTGLRLRYPGEPWSFDFESAYQFGTSRDTPLPDDQRDLDHNAWLLHLRVARVFGGKWRPILEFRYDYVSGDRDPDDGDMQRFDFLYGARSFEFGHSGIYGALARLNINSPALFARLHFTPQVMAFAAYRPAWLASKKDFLLTAPLRDPEGKSGSFIGHQFDLRVTWQVLPDNLMLTLGGSYLAKGEFLKNAPLAPNNGNTVYTYLAAELLF